MLGWLILFAFLTGAFTGSTALLGCLLMMSKDPETKDEPLRSDGSLSETPAPGTILSY